MATRFGARGFAVLVAVALAPWALADISDTVYAVELHKTVQGGDEYVGFYSVDFSQGTWNPETGEYSWYLEQDVLVTDFNGVPVGTLKAYNPETGQGSFITILPPTGRSPYQVNLGFAAQAGDAPTTLSYDSAVVSFPTINNADGRADAVFNLTDFDGDGATLDGMMPGGGAYVAQYNGTTPFTELMDPIVVGSFESNSVNDSYGFAPIGVPVSDMSSAIEFSLTANDLASGSSTFQIVPEPAAAILLLVGLAALRRR